MGDLFKVVDFRDDGMPLFAFEGRKKRVIDLYGFRVTTNVIVEALHHAGLASSDKWAVTKNLKPKEKLHFIMEKTWAYTESEAEKTLFNAFMNIEKSMPNRGRTLSDYIREFKISNPSEVIQVEYLRPGAFLRYQMKKAKDGAPIGQYKPPKIIPSEQIEIYDALKNA
jgi:hypothetical protein